MAYQYRVTGDGKDQIFTNRAEAVAAYEISKRLNSHLRPECAEMIREKVSK